MTTLTAFRKADERVTEIENQEGGKYLYGYGAVGTTKDYDEALKNAQQLYEQLTKQGIDPFNNMKYYKAVVTETTALNKGEIIANTKSPSQYKGMTKDEFIGSTKHISVYTITIIEF